VSPKPVEIEFESDPIFTPVNKWGNPPALPGVT